MCNNHCTLLITLCNDSTILVITPQSPFPDIKKNQDIKNCAVITITTQSIIMNIYF